MERGGEKEGGGVFEWVGTGFFSENGGVYYEAVSRGGERFRRGDCVLVRNGMRKRSWAAMIMCFYETLLGEKMADLLWFERSDHIRKGKRQFPGIHSELLICGTIDPNEVSVFEKKIEVVSYETFLKRYPKGLTKGMEDYDRVFYCRRGFHPRKEVYLECIDWDHFYHGQDTDFNALIAWIETAKIQTSEKREEKKRLRVLEESEDELVKTYQEIHDLDSEQDIDEQEKNRDGDIYLPSESDDESIDSESVETSDSSTDSFIIKTPHKRKKYVKKTQTPASEKRRIYKKSLKTTPLPLRYISCNKSSFSPYQNARSQLHVSMVPASLPCREQEFSLIYSQILGALEAGHGECIYISGTPGTGKTVTIKEVVRCLFQKVEEGEIDDFKYLEINGMRIIDANQAYSLLWEALEEERVAPRHALALLERLFSQPNPHRVPCVVLIDELDQLVTKDQKVMYNMFNWPMLQHSRLIVIAVANTMDLPERMLSNKTSSRLGLTRISFSGYTFDQLKTIIYTRLQGIPELLMDQDAIELASRKVSAVSGDARRALDICRRAVEIAQASAGVSEKSTPSKSGESTCPGRVTIKTINTAISEMSFSPVQTYLRTMPLTYKVFIVSLMLKMKRSGLAEHTLGEIIDMSIQMCKTSEKPLLQLLCQQICIDNSLYFENAAFALAEAGVLFLNMKAGKKYAYVQLKITQQDVKMAMQNDIDFKGTLNLDF
ncbi:hypothetical protein PORY_001793 [Pneumocystis oryctolagi]|uniref:Uncharacterized protein n=1 Tax=Pneumocystis oryctolagi TaxID=42067 RepID=A0ACB7CBG7_9ASCO|nr:hypothetical protein PORY_001793 [Pneumocystis oryctolagi]